MGFSIKVKGARFDDDKVFNSLSLPFLNGLTSEFILGGSLAESQRNLAVGANQLTEIGSPTWLEDSLSYSTATVNTGAQLTTSTGASNTMILVSEKSWGSGYPVKGGEVGFVGVSASGGCAYRTGAYSGLGNSAEIAQSNLPSGFVCFIGRGQAGALGKISAWNNGVEVTDTASANDGANTPGVMQIGGNDGTNNNGTFKTAYFAHYNRVLSDAECTQVYLSLKAFFATRGVSVS